jgi:hypothetical protein
MSGKLNRRPVFAISANSRELRRSNILPARIYFGAKKSASGAKRGCAAGQINQPSCASPLAYIHLIVSRFAHGLLEPFRCAICGVMALDPIGWNGPQEPLCARCADPVENREE